MTRAEMLARADGLAKSATVSTQCRNKNDNTAGNVAATREALVEEIEALRLTLLALFGPMAEAADVLLALMRTDAE